MSIASSARGFARGCLRAIGLLLLAVAAAIGFCGLIVGSIIDGDSL